MHSSALITYLPSPSLIALTGQPSAHAPHIMQSSLITYAISITSLFNIVPSLYHIVLKMYSVFDKFLVQNRFYVVRDVGAHVAVLLMLLCVDFLERVGFNFKSVVGGADFHLHRAANDVVVLHDALPVRSFRLASDFRHQLVGFGVVAVFVF